MLMLQGEGMGKVRLKVTYWPFDLLYSKPRDAKSVRTASCVCSQYVSVATVIHRPAPNGAASSWLHNVLATRSTSTLAFASPAAARC